MAKTKLQIVYYTAFLLLVVIPVCIIGIGTLGILRTVMLDSAISKIHLAQENISSILSSEVKDVSLQLAHLTYVNNSQILELAATAQAKDTAARYTYYERLSAAVNYVIKPAKQIVSLTFYMTNKESLYLKEEIRLPYSQISNDEWYLNAQKHKNTVCIGSYSTPLTYSSASSYADPFVIVAAMSPDTITDPSGKVETAALFIRSQASKLISDYNQQLRNELGYMYVTDTQGRVLIQQDAPDPNFPPELKNFGKTETALYPFRRSGALKKAIISVEPETGWRIVSVVDTDTLLQEFYQVVRIVGCITAALLLLFTAFSQYFLRNIIFPVNRMIRGLELVESGDFTVQIEPCGHSEARKMIHSFNHTVSRLKAVNEEKDLERQRKYEAELKALQSQINPHFLVNALNSIRFMAQVAKFDSLRKMAEALIKILTCSFRSNIGFYTLKEELEVLESYVYLMKIRYSEGFDVIYEINEACLECRLPRLILQPLVENAIVHGFEQSEEPGLITIRVQRNEQTVQIEIEDNGCGMNADQIERLIGAGSYTGTEAIRYSATPDNEKNGTRIGIKNVQNRLILNFGTEYGLRIHSQQGSGTIITVRIPHV